MNDKALLPCPFCGAEPLIYDQGAMSRSKGFTIICTGKGCPAEYDCPGLSRDETIAKWNTRTPSPDGVREAVDHLMIKRAQKAAPKFWKDYASAYDHMLHVLTSALSKPAGDE